MDRDPTAPEHNRGPSASTPGPHNPTAGHVANVPRLPVQTTLFDVEDFIHEGNMDEAAEMFERAIALRDYVEKVSENGFLEDAVFWAGLSAIPRGRAFVVNSGAPKLALRKGWVVKTGGKRAAEGFKQSHRGIVRQYRRPNNGGAP